MTKFRKPDFFDGDVELRFENDEICIYGTKVGLVKLNSLIQRLIDRPEQGHIHLEDQRILTKSSLTGAVAIFEG